MPSGVCHVSDSGLLPLSSFAASARQSSKFVTTSSVGCAPLGSHIHVTMLTVPAEDAELAADALWEAGASGVEERAGPTSATVTLVADATPVASRHGWRTETAEVDDGLDSWRAYARPWTAGRVRIRPPWLPAPGTDADAPGI